jgi:branched-chain amino acid transport system ATP-binding protein
LALGVEDEMPLGALSKRVAMRTVELTKRFGGNIAVNKVSLEIEDGTCTGIIGPNGSGKTTLLNVLSGELRPDSGEVFLGERNITDVPRHRRALLGMGRSFQHVNLFPNLTVLENVRLAVQAQGGKKWRVFSSHRNDTECYTRAMETLQTVGLRTKTSLPAFSLNHGEKRKLELAMILSQDPKVLLLDEPTAGMSVEEVPAILEILVGIRQRQEKTIVLVEHRMDFVGSLVDKLAVLLFGELIAYDSPRNIAADKRVASAYFGEEV